MTGAIIKSLLEETISKLQASGAKGIKKQSLVSKIKNEQVKNTELDFSGANDLLSKFGNNDKVPLEDVQSLLSTRKDKIDVGFNANTALSTTSSPKPEFSNIRETPFGSNEFADKVYQTTVFTKQSAPTISNHFSIDKYFSHIRFTDVDSSKLQADALRRQGHSSLENARYVHEIQSDVNQGARNVLDISKEDQNMADAIISRNIFDIIGTNSAILDSTSVTGIERSTISDTNILVEKFGVEMEDLLKVPTQLLEGSQGETRISDTLGVPKKVAKLIQSDIVDANKSIGDTVSSFKTLNTFKQDPGYLKSTINKMLVDSANEGQNIVKVRIAPDDKLLRAEGVQNWYEKDVVNTLKKSASQIGAKASMTADGYFRIELPKKFKLPLYSVAGVTVLSAGTGEAQANDIIKTEKIDNTSALEALKGGFSPDDITKEISKQGISSDSASDAIRTIVSPQKGEVGKELPPELPTDPNVDAEISKLNFELGNKDTNMPSIDQTEVFKALDNNFTPQDIQAEMVKQGISPEEAKSTIMSAVESKVPAMLKEGTSSEVVAFLKDTKGFSQDFIPSMLTPAPVQDTAGNLLTSDNQFTQEDFTREILDPTSQSLGDLTPDQLTAVLDKQTIGRSSGDMKADAENAASKFDNIVRKYNTFTNVKSALGSLPSKVELVNDEANVTESVFQNMRDAGYNMVKIIDSGPKTIVRGLDDPNIGDIVANTSLGFIDDQGNTIELTPSIMLSLRDSKLEIAGSVLSSVAAGSIASVALTLGTAIPPVTPPTAIVKLLLIGTAAIFGGAAGAGVGRGLDIAFNAFMVGEEISKKRVMAQMVDAGYTDAIYGVLTAGTFKLGSKALKETFKIARKLSGKGADLFISTGKAERALLSVLGITEEEAKDVIDKWAKLNGVRTEANGPLSEEVLKLQRQENLGILIQSDERGRGILAAAAAKSVKAANTIAAAAEKRAKDLLFQANKLTDPSITRRVVEDLSDYTNGLESSYSNAKEIGSKIGGGKEFKFDYDKVLYKPLNRQLSTTIQNPAKFDRVDNFVNSVATTSQRRDFKSLLDTRTQIGDFTRANADLDLSQKKVLRLALSRLDALVKVQSSSTEDGKIWHKAYKKTIAERDKMFRVKDNILSKALTKVGSSSEDKAKAFSKFIKAEDGTYANLVARLPSKTRDKVEAEVSKDLIKKHSVRSTTTGEIKAINFVALGEDMSKYAFTSQEAKSIKSVVSQLSIVYKNDIVLSRISSSVLSGGSGGISEQVVGRVNAALVKSVFDGLTQLLPTKAAGEKVLANRLSKVLENPLDKVSVGNLFQFLEGPANTRAITTSAREQIQQSIKELQIQYVKAGITGRPDILNTKGYATTRVGKERVVKNGKFGFGVYYKLDRPSASNKLKSVLDRVSTREVPSYRIADEELVSKVLGKIPSTAELKSEQGFIKRELEDAGYLGYKIGNDMLLFN